MAQNRIIIKATLENNEELRRFSVETANFTQIYEIIKQIFAINNCIVQYRDPEGDLVLISNDLELDEAILTTHGPLRVFIKQTENNINEDLKQKVPVNNEADNSFFGARIRSREEARRAWKTDPKIIESREQVTAAKEKLFAARQQVVEARKDLLASRESFLAAKKQLHEHIRAARDKSTQTEKTSAVPEQKLKILARFVKHVTIPDDSELLTNTEFTKTWRFRNESNRQWPETKLQFIGKNEENLFTTQHSFDVGTLAPGQEKDISIKMKTPALPGCYVSNWTLYDPETKARFGQKVYAKVNVVNYKKFALTKVIG